MRALAVIPTRYEPDRVMALARHIRDEVDVLLLDNGHEPPLPRALDTRGMGIYRQWNTGLAVARSLGYSRVAMLNDDITIEPGTLTAMVAALADPAVGIAYPGTETVTAAGGPYLMTGFCFAFRTDLPVGPFDESWSWWCGDTAFERDVLRAGFAVVGVPGSVTNESDCERNGWARRPELEELAWQDAARWAEVVA